jgi:hypothetical protein
MARATIGRNGLVEDSHARPDAPIVSRMAVALITAFQQKAMKYRWLGNW